MRKPVSIQKIVAYFLAFTLILCCVSGCGTKGNDAPRIGIAWRADTTANSYVHTVLSIERAGGIPVLLDQVVCKDLGYNEKNILQTEKDAVGALSVDAADRIKDRTWRDSNAKNVMKNIDAVVFTGGEDISPSLYREPENWHGVFEEINYNATRDVSDYLLMSYCLDQDIPVLGICRGMQMLAVVEGAKMIQDIPSWFAEQGMEYDHLHRYMPGTPEGERDYVPHDVTVTEKSKAMDIVNMPSLAGCPSLHHQAVSDIVGTGLVATGFTETCGAQLIEIIEDPYKTFVMGVQFHPEAAVGKHSAGEGEDFMAEDAALVFFRALMIAGNQKNYFNIS